MWFQRGFLLESYQSEQDQVKINLPGVDLTVERSDIGESPYRIDPAPDTSNNPISLAFADDGNEEDEEIELTGGEATLRGTFTDGAEPIAGAVVKIERHTDDGSASQQIKASSNGTWSVSGLLGGRYRVRAWVPGRYTTESSKVFFLEDGSDTPLDLQLREVEQSIQLEVYDGGSIYKGLTGSAVIAVTERTVDEEGFITTRPVPGKVVEVSAQSPLTLLSSPMSLTNAEGESTIRLRCNRIGSAQILVKMDEQIEDVALPPCIAIPPPTTTTPPTTAPPTTETPKKTTSSSSSSPTTTTPSRGQ